MAIYKYQQFLVHSDHAAFDQFYLPGQAPQHSGIYRCMGCGKEVVGEQSRQLPPQNHHQHNQSQGQIQWRLVVYADHAS